VLDALWPEQPVETSLNSLYKALHTLRRTLEPDLRAGKDSAYVDISNESIALVPHDGLWVDADHFNRRLHQAESSHDPQALLRSALDLYRGEFVADEPYVDWPVARREALRAARIRATLALARLDREAGDPLATVGRLEAVLEGDPTLEDVHRALIGAYLASGQRSMALGQVERCRQALATDLGTGLDPETESLARAARATPAPGHTIPEHAGLAPGHRAPGVPTPIVGRAGEVAAVAGGLRNPQGARMVTLVGTGGVGKTRIALEVAHQCAPTFPDGVAFVDLTAIRDPGLFHLAIAGALGIQVASGQPVEDLVRDTLVRLPRFLLVLDNLEHLPGIATPIARLLANLPALRILATSREPARIRAEWLYRIEPLAVPGATPGGLDHARETGAVALFLQRMDAWGAPPGPDVLADVVALCRRLDGLPLAIELAAARTWDTAPAAILDQLGDSLESLRGGPHDLPDRHQALESTIDWSYRLLAPAEQRLYRGLAVFAGGGEPDALTAVFGDDAVSLADRLADKSLVRWTRGAGTRRLEMLESLRDHAERKLAEHGERTAVKLRHARFFADLAVRSGYDEARIGATQVAWVRRLEREQDNIHLALANCLDLGESDTALIITNVMGSFWNTHLPAATTRGWIERALALEPEGSHLSKGWTAAWGAECAWRMGDLEAMNRFTDQAREIWTALDSTTGLAWVDYHSANRLGLAARHDAARDLYAAILPVFRNAGDQEGTVMTLTGLACALAAANRLEDAIARLEAALAASRDPDNLVLQAQVLSRLPAMLLAKGDIGQAAACATAGERIARLIGDRLTLSWIALAQAEIASRTGNDDLALAQAREGLDGLRAIGDRLNVWKGTLACMTACTALARHAEARAYALESIRALCANDGADDMAAALPDLAWTARALGHPAEALVAWSSTLASGHRQHGPGLRDRIATTRDTLPPPEADEAWRRGQRLPAAEAVALLHRTLAA